MRSIYCIFLCDANSVFYSYFMKFQNFFYAVSLPNTNTVLTVLIQEMFLQWLYLVVLSTRPLPRRKFHIESLLFLEASTFINTFTQATIIFLYSKFSKCALRLYRELKISQERKSNAYQNFSKILNSFQSLYSYRTNFSNTLFKMSLSPCVISGTHCKMRRCRNQAEYGVWVILLESQRTYYIKLLSQQISLILYILIFHFNKAIFYVKNIILKNVHGDLRMI